MFSAERKPHPAAEVLAEFDKMLKALPFEALPEMQCDAVCIADEMDVAYSAYVLARQAGINLKFQAARSTLIDSPVYFLPSVYCRGGISSENYQQLRDKVYNGAVCYISSDDCNLPGLRDFCGMQIKSRRQAVEKISCQLAGENLTLPCELEKSIQVETAEVLLRDHAGNPLLLANKFGKGTVYTLTFALEKTLYNTPRTYDSPWWQIYTKIVKKDLLLQVNDPSVIVTEHFFSGKSAAVIAVNCSDQDKELDVAVNYAWSIKAHYSAGVLQGTRCTLPAGGGMIFMLEK